MKKSSLQENGDLRANANHLKCSPKLICSRIKTWAEEDGNLAVARRCGVSEDTVHRMRKYRTRPRYESLLKMCDALIKNGRLVAEREKPRPIAGPILISSVGGADIRGEAEELARQVACTGPVGAIPSDAAIRELAAACDSLAGRAEDLEQLELAAAITLVKAGALIKLGSDLCLDQTILTVRRELARVRRMGITAGLTNGAAMTEAKLLRLLIPTLRDPLQRLHGYNAAQRLMDSIKDEQPLPFKLMLTGLPSEINRGHAEVIWKDGSDPISGVVPRPLRYQAADNMELAVQRWLLRPESSDPVSPLLETAVNRAFLGKELRWDHDQPRINATNAHATARGLQIALRALSLNQDPTGTQIALEVAEMFEDAIELIQSRPPLSAPDRDKFLASQHAGLALVSHWDARKLRREVEREVIPLVRKAAMACPNSRTILMQESIYQMVLLRAGPELHLEFAKACGFGAEELGLYGFHWNPPALASGRIIPGVAGGGLYKCQPGLPSGRPLPGGGYLPSTPG